MDVPVHRDSPGQLFGKLELPAGVLSAKGIKMARDVGSDLRQR
jgi:hypothetical protein